MNESGVEYTEVYSEEQRRSIETEFQRVKDTVYLDHAGATLYSEVQLEEAFNEYKRNLFANPHSKSTCSKLTEDTIDQIRAEILQFFNTNEDEYTLIFTAGATAALKLVAENFPFGDTGIFSYIYDNHTSVLGMREYAQICKPVTVQKLFSSNEKLSGAISGDASNLFVFPAQSNFSGYKYPLEWVEKVNDGFLGELGAGKWYCLLDAASYVSTSRLDLGKFKPDFVPVSFYKIFGYPTGLGALLVRNASSDVLSKKYFGGGTVYLAHASKKVVIRRNNLYERFEDGTLPFLSILALRHAFNALKRLKLPMESISLHVFNLAKYTYDRLLTLHHFNTAPVAKLYHNSNFDDASQQGGIINFNLMRSNGEYIGFAEVLNIANLHNIQLRTGCFCNPGACQTHLELTDEDVRFHYEQGHVCGDQNDLINGIPTGSVRISFGYMSSKADADKFLHMIESCFVEAPIVGKLTENDSIKPKVAKNNAALPTKLDNLTQLGVLQQIYVYPIKSCAAFAVSKWQLTPTGLNFDRQWMIVNPAGVCLTQKKVPFMCLIKPEVCLERNVLMLHFDGLQSISVPLNTKQLQAKSPLCKSKVCGDRIEGWDCGDAVSHWLSDALLIEGLRLIRQICYEENHNLTLRSAKTDANQQLSLANQAQFLLINSMSAKWLLDRLPKNEVESLASLTKRFRPNFVVDLGAPFGENDHKFFKIGELFLQNDGPCTRCQMICINQDTGEKSAELLLTLSKEFQGKITFGTYLKFDHVNRSASASNDIENGCKVQVPEIAKNE